MEKLPVILLVLFLCLLQLSDSGVPLSRYEKLLRKGSEEEGLYDANDKVISLTSKSLDSLVLNQNYATLLEFYNSFCGHCRRFAPTYKQLALDIWPWRDVVKVMAIDCAADENNEVCREYEIMAYPSIKYFPPKYEGGKGHFGENVKSQDIADIKSYIVQHVMNETYPDASWPNFGSLIDSNPENFFQNIPDKVQYGVIIYEPENSTLAGEMILDFSRMEAIKLRRVNNAEIASKFNIETFNTIAFVDRNANVETISVPNADTKSFKNIIQKFVETKDLHGQSSKENKDFKTTLGGDMLPSSDDERNEAIVEEVKNSRHLVYQADLEHALRYTIFHEIPKFPEIKGERLLALQKFINILNRYNPLGENGRNFIEKLYDYIMLHNQEIRGESFQDKLAELEKENAPVFSSGRWIGCTPSKPGLRGFTCGLWQLFHFMTVQAAESEKSSDPLEVLQAMHGYVKYFFGCSDCSSHFQEMAARKKIWNTSSKDDAILWLWSAHNEVNDRLAGDATEDPKFPKVQFPTKESCSECYREPIMSPATNEINWDKTEVLSFLKKLHNPTNVSRFGVDDDSVLPPTAEKLRQKRMLGNVFSDIDMRMGMLLYASCVVMMVVAVKLFLHRGYRKKPYNHDFLGKV